MVDVVFRDTLDRSKRAVARGSLDIPADETLERHVGSVLLFTESTRFEDYTLGPGSAGFVMALGEGSWFAFEVVTVSADGKSGRMLILREAE